MPISRGRILDAGRRVGDLSSITGVLGQKQGLKRRAAARALGGVVGRAQAGLSVWGLAGLALLFRWIDQQVREMRASEIWVGTAVRYGYWLNYGKKHMPKQPWWDRGLAETVQELENDPSGVFPDIAKPPNVALTRTTLYEGQQFIADIQSVITGSILGRLVNRFAGSASSRLLFGTILGDGTNPAMMPALLLQKNLMEQISKRGLVDTGCLLNSIALGNSKQEMLQRSKKGCMSALISSGEGTDRKTAELFGDNDLATTSSSLQ